MRIVILDAHTTNPGDLSWDELAALGDLTVYDRTPAREAVARALGAEIVITNKTLLMRPELEALPGLRYIGLLSTGTNAVDLAAAADCGVVVTNIPAYSTPSVAQMVFALLLELTNHIALHSNAVHAGEWETSEDFCFTRAPLIELAGKTFGVIGYGQTGRAVANIARAFGMRVLVFTRTVPKEDAPDIAFVPLEQVLAGSDILSLHCPLTPQTQEIINAGSLVQMKRGAFLINTGRGGLVNERDLAQALQSGHLAGAGLDVLSVEPPAPDNPLLRQNNCVITPHIAWASKAARTRLIAAVAGNLTAFLAGKPINVVTPPRTIGIGSK